MNKFSLFNGDFVQWLDDYDPEENGYFHALFADPPYALIENNKRFKNPNSSEPDSTYAGGAYTRQAKGFMGTDWDGFKSLKHYQEWVTSWAVKLPRIMAPGAVVAVFGGSRTFHRLAVGLEDGGLEIFDVVMWVYGSGMPKSLNIGRAIDRRSGMESAKKRRMKRDGTPSNSTRPGTSVAHNDWGDKDLSYTDFVTDEARRWGGHGTLLKPAYEPVILARIPRGKNSFIDLAQNFQTGALNIEKARIETAGAYDEAGRFPSNVVLSHKPGCKLIGHERRYIHAPGDVTRAGTDDNQIYGALNARTDERNHAPDGTELIEVWDCLPGCPVAQLDEQSGITEGKEQTHKKPSGSRRMEFGFNDNYQAPNYSDSGGASRFFYTGKASPLERILPGYLSPRRDLKKSARADLLAKMAGLGEQPLFGSNDIFPRDSVPFNLRWKFEPSRATHPTVKPIDLVTYLAKMLLPPDGGQPRRLLIPFSGVGSEMIGAHFAGWEQIQGVELTGSYIPQALDRLNFWAKYPTYESAIYGYNQKKDKIKKHQRQRTAEENAGLARLPLFRDMESSP